MNNKTKEMQAADMLAQSASGKRAYVAPKWEPIPIEPTSLICTTIENKPNETTEDDWENEWKDGGWTEF